MEKYAKDVHVKLQEELIKGKTGVSQMRHAHAIVVDSENIGMSSCFNLVWLIPEIQHLHNLCFDVYFF
jgi:hypothetical protein